MTTPGKAFKQIRLAVGLTQLQLARKLGYDRPQFISLIENGRSKIPRDVAKKVHDLAAKKNRVELSMKLYKAISKQIVIDYWR